MLAAAAALLAVLAMAPAANAASDLPPIRHVWVILLENESFNESLGGQSNNSPFNTPGLSPYLAHDARGQGNLLTQYWGTGHNSMDNYIAMVSGQSPTPDAQGDCLSGGDIPASSPFDIHGQIVGQGCTYPVTVTTLADQLEANDLTWKGYMQDFRDEPEREGIVCPARERNNPISTDQYVKKHDPWQWFHTIIDDQARCLGNDVSLTALAGDLQSVSTTPNFSFISPGLFDDGHDGDWTINTDVFLRQYVPMIMASPAYRQDGMILVAFDEAGTLVGAGAGEDTGTCCNEIPGPNSPMPGISGPGGGRTGALALSPFIEPDSIDDPDAIANPTRSGPGFYNHYSFLRSMEDLFDVAANSPGNDGEGHLGFAATYPDYPGPGAFGDRVYTGYDGSPGSPAAPPAPNGPTGPRAADGSTVWQNALPQGNDLQGVSCPTADACFAVGNAGSILSSTDGGATWSTQRSGSAEHLRAISCASATECVAVGDSGEVLTSTDGGGTWSSQDSGTGSALNGVSCPTASTCFAVGAEGTIVASTDSGSSWSPQSSGTDQPLYAVSCPSETACFAVGALGKIVSTTDGSSWSVKTLPNTFTFSPELRAVSCWSASACVAGGEGGNTYRTSDAGSSWTRVEVAGEQARGASCPAEGACFLIGENQGATGPQGRDIAGIFETTNGGAAWTQQAIHSTNLLRGVSCSSLTDCVAVGLRGSILRTTDGGANWETASKGTEGDLSRPLCVRFQFECLVDAVNSLRGVSFPDADNGFAVGSYRTVMATDDGGAHWQTQTSAAFDPTVENPPVPKPDLNAIACPTTSSCVAVGDRGSVITTSNGGQDWIDRDSNVKTDLLGVTCPTASTCFAVGSRGTILESITAGQSWSAPLSPGRDELLSDIGCSDVSHCVAVGAFGTALVTSNGGGSWIPGGSGTTGYLDAVDCPSAGLCLASGEAGTILRSTNQGASWSPLDSGVGDELMSLSCSDGSDCVASGSSGALVSTADGGDTWSVQGAGTDRALRAASCPSAGRCFVAGDAAAIQQVCPAGNPCISIEDTSVTEGDSGTADAEFTVRLSSASDQTVTVDYATQDGTATAPDDYTESTGTVTFDPGQTEKTVSVPVAGDTLGEGDETFTVELSNAHHGSINDGEATGTILDDDTSLSIDDKSVLEGDLGTTDATFTVTLDNPAPDATVSVDYATHDASATAPDDYTTESGTLTFDPGDTEKTVTVPVKGDLVGEGNETFTVDLSNPTGAPIVDGQGQGTIVDDDPKISIDDQTVTEGNSGTTDATFTVSLDAESTQTVKVDYATGGGTATATDDYTPASGTLTFAPGETEKTVPVPVKGDSIDEQDQTFEVTLSNPQNGTVKDAEGTGTITDDDDPPHVSIDDISAPEGDLGTAYAPFEISLDNLTEKLVTVHYGTADGTATAGQDYESTSGTVTFDPATFEEHAPVQTILVPIDGDTSYEGNETFGIDLSDADNASIGQGHGTGTITDDDPASPGGTPGVGEGIAPAPIGTLGGVQINPRKCHKHKRKGQHRKRHCKKKRAQ